MLIKEIDLAKIVIRFLQERDWEIYQEVRVHDRTCDIVAISGGFSWAIECKKSGLFKVMAQAKEWQGWASFVSVAIPWMKKTRGEHSLALELCHYLGIGLIGIRDGEAHETIRPHFNRHPEFYDIKGYLYESQKTFVSAGSKGGYFSPFKQTCADLKWYVQEHPGCSMKEAMGNIRHHYTSDITARAAMLSWLHQGIVPGIMLKREGSRLFLYLRSEKVSDIVPPVPPAKGE